MNAVSLGDPIAESNPKCFECPLSECNPGNPQCRLKGNGPVVKVENIRPVELQPTGTFAHPRVVEPDSATKEAEDPNLLTIGVILDGDERDLVWALWAIQRELERRRA